MSFIKYPSLTNHYVEKDIRWWVSKYPELENEEFVIREKCHGSNFSLLFSPRQKVTVCSRNTVLVEGSGDTLYGIHSHLNDKYSYVLDKFQDFVDNSPYEVVRVYGEFFGSNIQKGVDYGKEKRILFFTMTLDDEFLTDTQMVHTLKTLELDHLMAPELGRVSGLRNALEFDVKKNTTLYNSDKEINIMEGGVIQPANRVFWDQHSFFVIKKKNEEFKEKSREKRVPRDQKDDIELWGEEVVTAHENFLDYLNDNRVQSVFSKLGAIQSQKQLGDYIKEVINDAVDTFEREEGFDQSQYDKKQLKYILNCGSVVANMLKEYLK